MNQNSVAELMAQAMVNQQVLTLFLLLLLVLFPLLALFLLKEYKGRRGLYRHIAHTVKYLWLHRRKDRLSFQAEVWLHMRYIAWQTSPSRSIDYEPGKAKSL